MRGDHRRRQLILQERSAVIGRLRDQGLLIASSSKGDKKGYRLATSAHDLIKVLDPGNPLLASGIKPHSNLPGTGKAGHQQPVEYSGK